MVNKTTQLYDVQLDTEIKSIIVKVEGESNFSFLIIICAKRTNSIIILEIIIDRIRV